MRLAFAFLVLMSVSAGAAEVTRSADGLEIDVRGQLERSDVEKLRAMPPEHAVVSLDSPGGGAMVGIMMGRIILQRGYDTKVVGGCESACALIWVAGARRFMGPDAKIGLHAAWVLDQTGRKVPFPVVNNMIRSYIHSIGLGDPVYAMMEQEEIRWLTKADADRTGISVVMVAR